MLHTHDKLLPKNHRRDAPAINPTEKSSLFEVPSSMAGISIGGPAGGDLSAS
jgi:hypothetical protein